MVSEGRGSLLLCLTLHFCWKDFGNGGNAYFVMHGIHQWGLPWSKGLNINSFTAAVSTSSRLLCETWYTMLLSRHSSYARSSWLVALAICEVCLIRNMTADGADSVRLLLNSFWSALVKGGTVWLYGQTATHPPLPESNFVKFEIRLSYTFPAYLNVM